jgi:hypothetical protein
MNKMILIRIKMMYRTLKKRIKMHKSKKSISRIIPFKTTNNYVMLKKS